MDEKQWTIEEKLRSDGKLSELRMKVPSKGLLISLSFFASPSL